MEKSKKPDPELEASPSVEEMDKFLDGLENYSDEELLDMYKKRLEFVFSQVKALLILREEAFHTRDVRASESAKSDLELNYKRTKWLKKQISKLEGQEEKKEQPHE